MSQSTIQISEKFTELETRDLDERSRLSLGKVKRGFHRFQIYQSENGDILLRPMVDIPASEMWFFQNKKAVEFARKSLEDAAHGRVKELDPDTL